jgi:hypothetical protein
MNGELQEWSWPISPHRSGSGVEEMVNRPELEPITILR